MPLAMASGIICFVCLTVVSVAWRQEMRANNEKAKRERKRSGFSKGFSLRITDLVSNAFRKKLKMLK